MTITQNPMLNRDGHDYNRLDRVQAYKDQEWLQMAVENTKVEKAEKVRHALKNTQWPIEYISIITNCSVDSIRRLNEAEKLRTS